VFLVRRKCIDRGAEVIRVQGVHKQELAEDCFVTWQGWWRGPLISKERVVLAFLTGNRTLKVILLLRWASQLGTTVSHDGGGMKWGKCGTARVETSSLRQRAEA
jgi:hypothetical protein